MEKWHTQYYDSGEKFSECIYVNGQMKGKRTGYYKSGAVSQVDYWQNDDYYEWNKPRTLYYENGNVMIHSVQLNNALDGPYDTYYSNGNKRSESYYLNGYYDGNYKFYSKKGKILIRSKYEHSELKFHTEHALNKYIRTKYIHENKIKYLYKTKLLIFY